MPYIINRWICGNERPLANVPVTFTSELIIAFKVLRREITHITNLA